MLRIRPYKACDASAIVSWIQDEVTFYRFSANRLGSYPITAEGLNAHYDSLKEMDNFYEMTAFDESGVVGHFIMRFLDEEKHILKFGFVIVDATKRGKGYGKEMLKLALKYAFELLKVDAVRIGVFENNIPAHHCYNSIGFRDLEESEMFSVLGEEWKCLELEIKKEEWETYEK